MGLLDGILGSVLGGQQNQTSQQGTGSGGGLGQVLAGLLGGGGGGMLAGLLGGGLGGGGGSMTGGGSPLAGLLGRFQQAGLGNIAQSWVGTGPNQPIAPHQVEQAFGAEQVQSMADQAGMPREDFLTQLSQHLPTVVDHVTPGGRLPTQEELGDGPNSGGTVFRT